MKISEVRIHKLIKAKQRFLEWYHGAIQEEISKSEANIEIQEKTFVVKSNDKTQEKSSEAEANNKLNK